MNRPKASETEDDILRQQEEFLRNKEPSSVKLETINDLASKISNAPIEMEQEQPTINLVGQIIEKNCGPLQEVNLTGKPGSGFPQAKRRQISSGSKKSSIFSQQSKKPKTFSINLPDKSYVLSSNDSIEIHRQNIDTLSQMSELEIIDEQNKLLHTLDPKLVEFLRNKRKVGGVKQKHASETPARDKSVSGTIEHLPLPQQIIDGVDNWLNFETVEVDKLQWMRDINIPENVGGNAQYEARFDFNGWLLPFVEPEITETNRSLYHHGDEPGRPGYTIKELLQLSRANVVQQRIVALNTISNILSLHSSGVYDNIIDVPIEQIFFVVRISLDENSPSILNASLKAMHKIFCYQTDESCLDFLSGFGFGLVQPMLTVDSSDDDKEMNDQQLAEVDLVKCLVRSDILTRIRYIITTIKPSLETINYCLEILIRLARGSNKTVEQTYQTENLFSNIIEHFLPKIYKIELDRNNCYGYPIHSAIKLLRILACRSKDYAFDLVQRHEIGDSLLSYMSVDSVKLQTEALKLFIVLFRYNLCLEHFSSLQPFLLKSFNFHLQNTNCDEKSYILQNHFSMVINVISEVSVVNPDLVSGFIPLLMQCATKYFSQLSNFTDFKCYKLQIISSLLVALSSIVRYSHVKSDEYIDNIVSSLISSTGFEKITENIEAGSNLLCEFDTHKPAANFSSVEAAMWPTSDHTIPSITSRSPIPFLACFSSLVECLSNSVAVKFLEQKNINKYLSSLKNCCKFNLTANWFTKPETMFILNILKCSSKVQNKLSDSFLFFELTVKCLSIFTVEHQSEIDYLLKNIVFNKDFYPNDLLLKEMNINDNKNEILNVLPYLGEIYKCYSTVLGLKKTQQLCLTLDLKIGNIIPHDWVFTPIVVLYTQSENKQEISESNQLSIIVHSLQWIFLYESYFPDLSSLMTITDSFCRLCCIFLCSNTLFLEKNVNNLLELCFKALMKPENYSKINFDQKIEGLNNFQDFYVQVLEQYQGVSYGDILFANFILLPLCQKQNPKYRKIFWSEYIGVAQTITVDLNQSLVDLNEFINPPETDMSLLVCYRRALKSRQLERSLFLKYIAEFHVENYVQNIKKN